MSDDNKPKKDLRARLGRTISPNTPGAAPIAAPKLSGGSSAATGGLAPMPRPASKFPPAAAARPASAAPRAVAPLAAAPLGATPAAAPAGAPAASLTPPPIATSNPLGAPASKNPFGPPSVAAPPFGAPAAAKAATKSEAPKAKPADPFAAAAQMPAQQNEVRLVIDDKAVSDAEIGRKSGGRGLLAVSVGLVVGAALGIGAYSTNSQNVLYNHILADAKEVHDSVRQASEVLDQQNQRIQAIATAAGASPPTINYEAIEALKSVEVPFSQGQFSHTNYNLFRGGGEQGNTVDNLFRYYNNILVLWQKFDRLNALARERDRPQLEADAGATFAEWQRTQGEPTRAGIDQGAAMMAEIASGMYGVVPQRTEAGVRGRLVFVQSLPNQAADEPLTRVMARATRAGRASEINVFDQDTDITDSPNGVILVPGSESAGVLSEQVGPFRRFATEVREIGNLMEETREIQTALMESLNQIAALEPRFAIGGGSAGEASTGHE